MIYTFDHNSQTVLVMIVCDITNKREYLSLSFDSSVIIIKFDLIFFRIEITFDKTYYSSNNHFIFLFQKLSL